jgi:hypothetical protein
MLALHTRIPLNTRPGVAQPPMRGAQTGEAVPLHHTGEAAEKLESKEAERTQDWIYGSTTSDQRVIIYSAVEDLRMV